MTKNRRASSSNQPNNHPLLLLLFSSLIIRHAGAQPANAAASPPSTPYGFNANFNPSLAIIIVVLVSAFFFMGFFTIYIRQCAGGSHRPTTTRSRRGALGLHPEIIETFPTFLYSYVKDLKIGKAALECAVCLSEFEDQETLRLLPKCDHVFHPDCIDAWLASHTTCPVCRSDLSLAANSDQPQSTATPTTAASTTAPPISDHDEHNSGRSEDTQNQSSPEIDNNHTDETVVDQVVVTVTVPPPDNSTSRSRIPAGAKKRVSGRFPRSHSTGHSVVRPGEDCERFTLRLPEEVRRQIVESVAAARMKRAKSCVVRGEGSVSSRRGEGSSRGRGLQFWRTGSDRWSFFSRGGSVKSPRVTDGEGSTRGNSRSFVTSVTAPFDCIGSKGADATEGGEGSTAARLPV